MKLGEAIKEKREKLGMTQQDLAEKLFVSRQTVCRWENGTRCPDLIMAKKIALVLNISLDELIPGEALASYVPPKEPALDLSCIKVMLTGLLLVLADTASRSIGSGTALPVGAITSLLGAPFFIAIIFGKKEGHRC